MHDQSNLNPPVIGQQLPVYPALLQILKVTSATPVTANVYSAKTEQLSVLTLRDREDCYVLDCNGAGLTTAYYAGRLVGSYNAKPLYAVGGAGGGTSVLQVDDGITTVTNVTEIIFPAGTISGGGGIATYTSLEYDLSAYRESNVNYTAPITGPASDHTGDGFPQNQIFGIPFIVSRTHPISKLAINILALDGTANGHKVELAIYDTASPALRAVRNFLRKTTQIPVDTTGVTGLVSASFAAGGTLTATPGMYWLCINSTSVGTVSSSYLCYQQAYAVLGMKDNTDPILMFSEGVPTPGAPGGGTVFGTWPNPNTTITTKNSANDAKAPLIIAIP